MRYGRLSVRRDTALQDGIGTASNGCANGARFCDGTAYGGIIGLLDLILQGCCTGSMFCHQTKSCRVPIQTIDRAKGMTWKLCAERISQSVGIVPRRRVHWHAGRLIIQQIIFCLKDDGHRKCRIGR